MNKQQLATKIWESANQMRSKIEANEYKDYILGFIFYKYLSDKLERFATSQDFTEDDLQALSEDDPDTVAYFQSNLGYFISYDHLFETWLNQGSDFQVSDVRDALSAFSRLIHPDHKLLFDGIFKTLETGLSKLGDTAAKQTKAVSDLIQLIKDIPMDGRVGYDVLGFIYEYLISMFAANAGKKAGEFYTPHEVSVLISEIIADHVKGRNKIDIYDPTSGSGSLLLNIGQSIAKQMGNAGTIKYFAQELKENTYNLTRMNLIMRDILPANIVTRNGDTLEDDWPFFEDNDPAGTYQALYLDAVVSNPPYSQKWDPAHKDSDPRYARFGLAPKSKADYAFLLHDLYHLKPDGIMAIVLPHGVLFRGGEEGQIRKQLIENDHIDAIIGLPANIFFGTGIPTIILVLKQKRAGSDVLIVDASRGFAKEGKNNKLRACDIKKISDVVIARESVLRYSRVVSKDEIRSNGYNLNIPRYVDSSEPAESWDLYASMFGGIPKIELEGLNAYWRAFDQLRDTLFTDDGTPYVVPRVQDFAQAIAGHVQVQAFKQQFAAAFADFPAYLKTSLIGHMRTLHVPRQEAVLGAEIFKRLAPFPLIDKYQAYQLLDDEWQQIAVDLEILQTEGQGVDAARKVEPNMVIKKKDGKDTEVQDGWRGRVLPFALVQAVHHASELAALQDQEKQLSEASAAIAEILEGLTEEEKNGSDAVHESGDKFVNVALAKEAKQYQAEAKQAGPFADDALEAKIIQAAEWVTKESALKTAIKKATEILHLQTKATIEGLSDAQVHRLLERKWIAPLQQALHRLPVQNLGMLTSALQALAQKYRITYANNAREIQQTEAALAGMLGELEGDEFDMKGVAELKALFSGERNEETVR
ncbi:type I restriction-modification system subunit M [Paraburkholderia sp. RL17-381-BIF-C]|uniref:type I restriction-modification system subunit M n=1 Tax=Paraburkholderia sp. RL17-381-BIF-C TaxID=3031635 RepID=UPI0038BCBDF8